MNPHPSTPRVRIYQLLPRLFGNVNGTRKPHGTLAENGVGKFADINDAVLAALRAMGCTHLWLTGVLRQTTATEYAALAASKLGCARLHLPGGALDPSAVSGDPPET